jgi:hypothetical protein
VTILAKPEMFNLGYATSLPDDSHHSPTTKVAQFPMAVRVEALRNHIDSRQDPVLASVALLSSNLLLLQRFRCLTSALLSATKCAEACVYFVVMSVPWILHRPLVSMKVSWPKGKV